MTEEIAKNLEPLKNFLAQQRKWCLRDMAEADFLWQNWMCQQGYERKAFFEVPQNLVFMRQHKNVFLSEFQEYQSKFTVPRFQSIDAMEGKILDREEKTAWRTLFLRICFQDTSVAKQFPKTMALLQGIECPLVMFSVLEPGKTLPEHCGYFSGVLRYHLGLQVPPDCWLTVNRQKCVWEPDILFDDTFPHSVQNNSDQPRLVLLLDIPRPFHEQEARDLNHQFLKIGATTEHIRQDLSRVDLMHQQTN